MSGIVLSASVRQNLLSLQSTAQLLATTQNDLATGNKVNSALDNPTSYFTAQALNNRASDINNLLDGIGNGVQVLQAANTGITSLQSLVANAQSIANQVLQTTVGYSTKSSFTATITGATANNLLGPGTNATVTGSALVTDKTSSPPAITAATQLVGTAGASSDDLATAISTGSVLTVDGKTITFSTATTATSTDGSGNVTIGIGTGSTATVQTVLSAIDGITGAATASVVTAGSLVLSTGTAANLVIAGSGNVLTALGLTAATTNVTPPALSGETLTIGATVTGGTATSLTFGTANGQVSTLNELNAALQGNDLQASIELQRCDHDHDFEQRGVVDDWHDRWHRSGIRSGLQRPVRGGSSGRSELAGDPHQPGSAVQPGSGADQHHGAGFLVQRHQPLERRYPRPDLRRNRRFQAVDFGRHLQ